MHGMGIAQGTDRRKGDAVNFLQRLYKEEDGATATEYAIIVAILGVALIGIFTFFSGSIEGFFEGFVDQVD